MHEGATGYALVQVLEVINAVYRRLDGKQNFNMSRDGLVGWNDCPGLQWMGQTCITPRIHA